MTNKVGKLNVNFGRSPVERMGARVLEPNELSKGLSGKLTPPGEIYPTVFISTAVQGRHIGKFNSNLSFSSKRFKLFSSESNLGLIQIGLLNNIWKTKINNKII